MKRTANGDEELGMRSEELKTMKNEKLRIKNLGVFAFQVETDIAGNLINYLSL